MIKMIKIFLCSLLIAGEGGQRREETTSSSIKSNKLYAGLATLYDLGQVA